MSHSQLQNVDLLDPFATQPKSSLFTKLGNKLGGIFVSAKKGATRKYLEVTQGINQRIEAENEHIQAEIYAHLEAQAEEFELELYQRQKRWFWTAFILVMLAFILGAATGFFFKI